MRLVLTPASPPLEIDIEDGEGRVVRLSLGLRLGVGNGGSVPAGAQLLFDSDGQQLFDSGGNALYVTE